MAIYNFREPDRTDRYKKLLKRTNERQKPNKLVPFGAMVQSVYGITHDKGHTPLSFAGMSDPQSLVDMLVGVQPMTPPTGAIFNLKSNPYDVYNYEFTVSTILTGIVTAIPEGRPYIKRKKFVLDNISYDEIPKDAKIKFEESPVFASREEYENMNSVINSMRMLDFSNKTPN